MKYLTPVGIFLIFSFIVIFIVAAATKNFYAFGFSELCALAGIACVAKANRKEKTPA